jgi:hypothetical protein
LDPTLDLQLPPKLIYDADEARSGVLERASSCNRLLVLSAD